LGQIGRREPVGLDLLALNGRDWRQQPLMKRHARLQVLLERFGCPAVSSSEPFDDGLELLYRLRTVSVDSFAPNPWGLYNAHGNVWEWTEDCWNDSNIGNPGDGRPRTTGDCSRRVVRGGAWYSFPQFLRSAYRGRLYPQFRFNYGQGFQLATMLNPLGQL
jgi:hypothetical protein